MAEKSLPFPRGQFYSDGGLTTVSTTMADNLPGTIYEVEDTVHGTGVKVLLRAVRNESGGDITVARKFCDFSTTAALDHGRSIEGMTPASTSIPVKPIDDKYTAGVTWSENDIGYVVEAGPCNVVTEGSSVSLSAGNSVASDTSGCVNGAAAAAGEYVAGVLDADAAAVDTNVVVWITAGLGGQDAAG